MEGLWPRESNSLHRPSFPSDLFDGLPRKSDRGRAQAGAPTARRNSSGGGGENGAYHLSLLLEAPGNAANVSSQGGGKGKDGPAFDFVCSSSGVTATPAAAEGWQGGGAQGGQGGNKQIDDEAVGFDRVCALRGEVVHIFTIFYRAADDSRKDTDAPAARRTTSVSLELEHAAERAAWNSTASCVVVGDVSGRLHFVTGEGALIFSQPLARPVARRVSDDGEPDNNPPRAFSCIKFAAVSPAQAAGAEAPPAGGGQELVAVSASMQLFHFTSVPFAAIEAACLAQDVAALKKLRASIRVSVADASEPPSSSPSCSQEEEQDHLGGGRAADACVQSLHGGGSSRVFLVSGGGVSVWQRRRGGGGGGCGPAGRRSRYSRSGDGENGDDGVGEGGAAAPSAPAPGKLVKIDGIPRGELFGGGSAVSLEVSADGRWIVVVDDRGGLSWWDARTLLRLGRWSWPTTAPSPGGGGGGGAFRVAEAVVLTSSLSGAVVDGRGGGGDGVAVPSSSGTGTHGDATGGGDARPCLVCVSADGEVRVLRLGAEGVEELHRAGAGAGAVPGARAGMITVPSPSRHQFLLVTSDVASGKVAFQLGKEAVPRHRLQALLARGDFEGALELAQANSMDETDVHAARLLALLREAGGATAGTTAATSAGNRRDAGAGVGVGASSDGVLSPRFFEDARALLEKLDSPAVLGRACEAAVRTPLPSLEDVRKLLEVVENRLRSFDKAGTRVRNLMLERMAGVLARLRTFELIEGGRRPSLPLIRPHAGGGGGDDASDGLMGDGGSPGATGGKENEDGTAGEAGGETDGGDGSHAGVNGGAGDNMPPHAADSTSTSSEEERDLASSEVARWLRFRTADLVCFVGRALQAGDVQAAAVAWRRHGRGRCGG